jgi:hypothetical protein
MARFAILNTVDWDACAGIGTRGLGRRELVDRLSGCAWLFSVEAEVEDVAEAAREAVQEFFSTDEGRKILRSEEITRLGWEEAIPWVSDEVWASRGLELLRHPDVQRVVVDADEELLAPLSRPA